MAPGFNVLPSPSYPTSKGSSVGCSSCSSALVSIPGIGLLVSKCAISGTPSGTLVSDTPIGNLFPPKITSTNCQKAANTLVLVTLTKTLDFSDSLNFTFFGYSPR